MKQVKILAIPFFILVIIAIPISCSDRGITTNTGIITGTETQLTQNTDVNIETTTTIQTSTAAFTPTDTTTHDITEITATVPINSGFLVSDLSVEPDEVIPCEQVTVTVVITNIGKDQGTYDVILNINGVEEDRQSITLGAGTTEKVFFTVAKDDAGTYVVEIDGLTGSFSVVSG